MHVHSFNLISPLQNLLNKQAYNSSQAKRGKREKKGKKGLLELGGIGKKMSDEIINVLEARASDSQRRLL